jgi:prepilin signal peptidase PulO-like enzyme (type II secretory pathway)
MTLEIIIAVSFYLSILLLIAASVIDLKKQEVEWWVLVPAMIFSFVYGTLSIGFTEALPGLISAVSIPLILVILSREKWMGWGDVLFAAIIGFLLPHPQSLLAVTIAFISGALFGIIYSKVNSKVKALPFGPFLTFGGIIMLIFGNQILTTLENLL